MKKQQNKLTEKLNYEKVYEHPLDWCPLFGYMPELEKTHLKNNHEAYLIADRCLGIIQTARLYLGVYDHQMAANICLPDVKELIFPYKECEIESKSIRLLFKNLDFLALKTSPDPLAVDMCRSIAITKQGMPHEPIGRVSNACGNCFSSMAGEIKVIHHVVREYLLSEAQKIIGDAFKLEETHLYALYAILEAWLVLTELLFNPSLSKQMNELLSFQKKLSYADAILHVAVHYSELEEKNELYRKRRELAVGSSIGGSNKPKGIRIAIEKIIKIQHDNGSDASAWDYIKENHKGKTMAWKCGKNWVCWKDDPHGEKPEGIILEYDCVKQKLLSSNTFESFCRNFKKSKKEINNKIK